MNHSKKLIGAAGIYNIPDNADSGHVLYGDASNISGDVSNISGDVSYIRGDVSNISGNVSAIIGNVSNISGDVSNIVGDVSKLYGDVSNVNNISDVQTTPLPLGSVTTEAIEAIVNRIVDERLRQLIDALKNNVQHPCA